MASTRIRALLAATIALAALFLLTSTVRIPFYSDRSTTDSASAIQPTAHDAQRDLADARHADEPIGSAVAPAQAAWEERVRSAAPQAQPPRTFIGPDGKPQEIVYNQGLALSPGARDQLKQQLLAEMRAHPEAVSQIYGISRADIAAVLDGTKPFPESLLNQ